jgi:hypothetical protein
MGAGAYQRGSRSIAVAIENEFLYRAGKLDWTARYCFEPK